MTFSEYIVHACKKTCKFNFDFVNSGEVIVSMQLKVTLVSLLVAYGTGAVGETETDRNLQRWKLAILGLTIAIPRLLPRVPGRPWTTDRYLFQVGGRTG